MKKYLFMIALLASVFSFSACSDDDDDIDVNQIEGTWGLTIEEGYEYYEGEKKSGKDTYDPTNPTEDCEKIIVSKVSDNTFSATNYYYYNNKWNKSSTDKFTLDGPYMIYDGEDADFDSIKILVANSKQLVIEIKGTDNDGDFYYKKTYTRM